MSVTIFLKVSKNVSDLIGVNFEFVGFAPLQKSITLRYSVVQFENLITISSACD